ncbi:hypothetical protein FocTR4_00014442 [Fusarium oxysporum f. sp. cubense]|uniref:Uncharacterized protein n=1 Tax=Fusarium oxysporum f. sp. cubense TaxID=61366 RepID=A0A5C6SNC3_FUSOC|nr:hypothetical protein FocTR4_00014442 [Fusarium oxysporum f. sp. cubense]
MMNQLGVPENVAMVLVKCFLQSKGIGFTQNHTNETGLGDEKALDTSQLAQEERELLTILQTFDKESSQINQTTFETGVRQKMARETLARAILETWEAGGGSLSSLQHARLQELQNVSAKLSEDLQTCRTDLAASKKRSQELRIEGKALVERLTLEHEIQSILEHQRRQNGFLYLSDRLRLRSAQARSNDLSAAVSVDPLVNPNAKGPKLISPDQKDEDQSDDAKAMLEKVGACAREFDMKDFNSED